MTSKIRKEGFDAKFETFLTGCKTIYEDYKAKQFPGNPSEAWRVDYGTVRLRVVHGGSSYCFVDYETGDVLKCAGYKAPAKHARGNIFDEKNGLGSIGPYGPAYLR